MKRTPNFLIIFAAISLAFSMSGCSSQSNTDKALVDKTAYDSLYDNDKKTIKNWEKAKLEDYKADKDHEVRNLKAGTSTNLKDIDTYMVVKNIYYCGLATKMTEDKNAEKNITYSINFYNINSSKFII